MKNFNGRGFLCIYICSVYVIINERDNATMYSKDFYYFGNFYYL